MSRGKLFMPRPSDLCLDDVLEAIRKIEAYTKEGSYQGEIAVENLYKRA